LIEQAKVSPERLRESAAAIFSTSNVNGSNSFAT
jgi:hypothetical protein